MLQVLDHLVTQHKLMQAGFSAQACTKLTFLQLHVVSKLESTCETVWPPIVSLHLQTCIFIWPGLWAQHESE